MDNNGVTIDKNSLTVVLIGAEVITMLLQPHGRKLTLDDFNKIAVELLMHFGVAYGVDLDTTDFNEWGLGCVNKEDSKLLVSYLADPHAEVTLSMADNEISPVKENKKCLH